eukprot:jgi/Chrpa1/13381/Chrysochromulina_OHIO_Genome00004748-RA
MNTLRAANGTSVASRSRNDSSEERLEERLWRRCEDQLSGIKAGLSAKAAALDAALAALESKMLMRVEDMRAKTLRECTKKCEDQLSGTKAGLSAKAAALDAALAASESKMLMRVEDMLKDLRAKTTRECTKGCNEKAVRDKVQTDVSERLASASAVTSEKLMQVMMTLETRLRKSQETATREQEERNERLSSELELLQERCARLETQAIQHERVALELHKSQQALSALEARHEQLEASCMKQGMKLEARCAKLEARCANPEDRLEHDEGRHTVCIEATEEFLKFSASVGNDLSTPYPQWNFPGVNPGDEWCLCATRWVQALNAGCAPKLHLLATHEKTLSIVAEKDRELLLSYLKKYAVDAAEAEQALKELDAARASLEKLLK